MEKRIIFQNLDGTVGIIIPSQEALDKYGITAIAIKDVPANLPYKIADATEIPSDRTFRGAWELSADTFFDIITNINKAKEITHETRRNVRAKEFAPLDQEINISIANVAKVAEVEAQRQAIRDKYATIKNSIDACSTADKLKAIIQSL